ncbi:MAG: sulfur carrier protein ThiS [Carbonactinosporaceae bacterium]
MTREPVTMLTITLNGRPREVGAGTTVAAVVATVTTAGSGVAVALNDAIVPRGDWTRVELGDADRIEVLTAVQGG